MAVRPTGRFDSSIVCLVIFITIIIMVRVPRSCSQTCVYDDVWLFELMWYRYLPERPKKMMAALCFSNTRRILDES